MPPGSTSTASVAATTWTAHHTARGHAITTSVTAHTTTVAPALTTATNAAAFSADGTAITTVRSTTSQHLSFTAGAADPVPQPKHSYQPRQRCGGQCERLGKRRWGQHWRLTRDSHRRQLGQPLGYLRL